MTKEYEIGDADHALDRNQQFGLLRGNGHIEGGPAEIDAEAEPPTVTAPTPWSVYVDGETVDIDGENNTVELPQPHPTLDRWDVIYVDPDGAVQVESGGPAEVIGERGLQAREPAPPSFAEIDGVVIAAAYRQFDEADGAAFGLSELFYDRRVRTLADVESLAVKNADIESLTVSNAPETDTDALRKLEADALQENIDTLNTAFEDHSERHQNNGEDELNVEGLSGDLADRQDPKDHQERHHEGGPDAIAEGSLTRQDPTNHGERHHDGGSDSIDPADLDLIGNPGLFLSGEGWSAIDAESLVESFDVSGTWEKPDEKDIFYIECVGAGGGGAGAPQEDGDVGQGGGGGGAGGVSSAIIRRELIPESVEITVGSGGAGGASLSDGWEPGEDGGDTSFGDYITAFGGVGGGSDSRRIGGVGSEGDELRFNSIKGGNGGDSADSGISTSAEDTIISPSGGGAGAGTLNPDENFGGDGGSNIIGAGGVGGGQFEDGEDGGFAAGGGGGGGSDFGDEGIAGSGGAGGAPGGGGGGSGKGREDNGVNDGGGDGGNGVVIIIGL